MKMNAAQKKEIRERVKARYSRRNPGEPTISRQGAVSVVVDHPFLQNRRIRIFAGWDLDIIYDPEWQSSFTGEEDGF